MARVWVLYASNEQRREVDQLLADSLRATWKPQPYQPNGHQTSFELDTEAAQISSQLARIGCMFEVEGDGERYLHHPGLGIKRQQLDEAGEVLIRFGQLQKELGECGGNFQELLRRLRLIEGQPWLDLLEPYRLSQVRYAAMPKAV